MAFLRVVEIFRNEQVVFAGFVSQRADIAVLNFMLHTIMFRMFFFHMSYEIISSFPPTIVAVWLMAAIFLVPMNGHLMTASTGATRESLCATVVSAMEGTALRTILGHCLVWAF